MRHIDINMKLTQARSLSQFRTADGKGPRILGMLYFNRLADGTLWADNIRDDTDVTRLQVQIKDGRIFVVEEIREIGNEKSELT